MRSLINKIINTKLLIKYRNYFGIKPLKFNDINLTENFSISDAFLWRTDNNIETCFKFNDLLRFYFKEENTCVDLIFFDKNFNQIKKITKSKLELSNKITIDKKFMDGLEDYGFFYIFHRTSHALISSIRNSCYLGFSFKGNLNSFVHGNTPTAYQKFNGKIFGQDIVGISLLKNNKYRIQNYFSNLDKSEIFINNPTLQKINFSINDKNYYLNKGSSKIIDVSKYNQILILSNCYFLRPIIFSYKDNFLDVYHG